VAANRLTAKLQGKKVKNFAPTSFDCDARTFRFVEKDWAITVSTTGKRLTLPLRASNYHRGKLTGQNPTSAQVCLHRDGGWYVHIQLKSEPPKPINADNIIGVDFGRRDIAVTSTDKSWSGESIKEKRINAVGVRASLQKKASQGTRATRRRCREILKRLSGRERRYQAHLNHVISKAIVAEAKLTNSIIAIEDLTGIRERTNQQPRIRPKEDGLTFGLFINFDNFSNTKALKKGLRSSRLIHDILPKPVIVAYISELEAVNRLSVVIRLVVGLVTTANGSQMIRLLGLSVIQPRDPNLLACPIDSGLRKAPVKPTL
jgi:transposase